MYSAANKDAWLVGLATRARLAILTDMDISRARKHHGLTQERVAAVIGVSRSAVAQWEMENGTRPDPANARKLMKLLPGLTFNDIYPEPKRRAA